MSTPTISIDTTRTEHQLRHHISTLGGVILRKSQGVEGYPIHTVTVVDVQWRYSLCTNHQLLQSFRRNSSLRDIVRSYIIISPVET